MVPRTGLHFTELDSDRIPTACRFCVLVSSLYFIAGVYPATRNGGELPLKQSYSPWRRIINSPVRGSTCFDEQLTRPLHANLLLQHETEGTHTTKS